VCVFGGVSWRDKVPPIYTVGTGGRRRHYKLGKAARGWVVMSLCAKSDDDDVRREARSLVVEDDDVGCGGWRMENGG
jgi:hypothetical protein